VYTLGLTRNAILYKVRAELGDFDTSPDGRWSDAVLINHIDSANKRAVRDVLFPDSRIEQPTVAGVQLYQFPLMLKVKNVYVGGQLIYPSDIPTLQGQQIGYQSPVPDGTVPGPYADVPDNSSTGMSAPKWTVQSPLSYPGQDGCLVTPAPDAQPWYCGSPPRYYWRGGWIGLVPIPANLDPVSTIAIDGVRQPDTILTTGIDQALTTPENFLDAIVWAAVENAKFGDDGPRSDAQRQAAGQNYEREKRKLIEWRGEFPGEQRNGPKVNTLRPLFAGYHTRRVRGGRY
jgi:hypothetical protein